MSNNAGIVDVTLNLTHRHIQPNVHWAMGAGFFSGLGFIKIVGLSIIRGG